MKYVKSLFLLIVLASCGANQNLIEENENLKIANQQLKAEAEVIREKAQQAAADARAAEANALMRLEQVNQKEAELEKIKEKLENCR